jgi:hypothetical protein
MVSNNWSQKDEPTKRTTTLAAIVATTPLSAPSFHSDFVGFKREATLRNIESLSEAMRVGTPEKWARGVGWHLAAAASSGGPVIFHRSHFHDASELPTDHKTTPPVKTIKVAPMPRKKTRCRLEEFDDGSQAECLLHVLTS